MTMVTMDNEVFINVDSELPKTAVLEDGEILDTVKDDDVDENENENDYSMYNSAENAPSPSLY